ncbi:MAG: hypothetical protein J1G02_01865 [Clostridiales bacterium]|nr:hypothetical protein [Clostridiales bacterium]
MRRNLSVILVIVLVVATTLLLVACGGDVKTEQEWNAAMERLKNGDTLTISYKQEKSSNARTTKTYDTWTVTYDTTKGVLYAEQDVKSYNLFGVLIEQINHYQYVELEDVELKNYTKHVVENRNVNWEATSRSYASEDEAVARLKEEFASYLKLFNLDNLNYNDFALKKGKYQKSEVVNEKNTLWQLTFADGQLNTVHFESKHKKGSSDIDYTKIDITIQYSAEITTPTDLENAFWK